ncbi:IclR family transcriptional regulator [Natronorubrum aibiense]|uniref:Helix-turn-helix domain-containing protein n=1 Tax=Natronorubrum aibiense TaxID=348826 RepID=A0A5P9P8V6_9EURY|nr:IclR family transcriptional regulator [Natronorubrum aibiense]QFU84544.1 helix-turn-helix domain-containing protein [Natronorubrum aibiense]
MGETTTARPVRTTKTSFRIIEFVQDHEHTTLTEIADGVDIAYSTAHNHLATLCEEGWLVEQDGVYEIGLKFLHLGRSAYYRTPLFNIARRHVSELAEQINLEVEFLVEEHGRLISIADVIHEPKGYGNPDESTWSDGRYYYMHNTASGKVILAELPDDRVEEILDRWGLPAQTPYSVTDREQLYDQLDTIRDQGYAEIHQEVLEGFSNISAAVTLPDGRVFGSLSIGWPTYIYENGVKDEMIDNLLNTVDAIEADFAAQLE